MKTSKALWFVFGFAVAVFAAPVLAATYQVETDKPEGVYRCGETATFTVTVLDTANLRNGDAKQEVRLDNFGTQLVAKASFDMAKGAKFSISGTLEHPGFLRLTLPETKGHSEVDAFVFSAGFEPEKIHKGSPSPADFDEFWAEARKKLAREVPLDPRMEPVAERTTDKFDFYRVSFATFGRRIYGFLSVPKDKTKAPFPVRIGVNAAGFGDWTNNMQGSPDAICAQFAVYDWPMDWKWRASGLERKYDALNAECDAKYSCGRYSVAGITESREQYFFYPVLLGIDRAVDWIAASFPVDAASFTYQGTSQGGGFGFYLCGLNHRFTRAAFYVPAITDTMGYLAGRKSGWPSIIENNSSTPERRAAAERWAPYFDGANFASRIECPVRVAVGFSDSVCPPCAVYAAYNEIKVADKAIVHGIGMTHDCFRRFYDELGGWATQRVAAAAELLLPEVKVGDTALRVEAARCSAMPVNIRWPGHQRELDQTEICSFARFDFNGSAEVCVTPRRAFTNVVVRPASAKVAVRREGDSVRFTITKAGAYSVEFDGRHRNLMLFADPPHDWSDVDRSAANVRYFGPGEHDAGLITLKAGETLFIDEGAVVYGRVFAKDAPGIRICGKGILDSSRVRAVPRAIDPALAEEQRRKGWAITNVKRFDAVRFEFCDDVRIEGITIRDSPLYTIRPICCDNLLVDNVKIIGNWRYNSDGIDMHNCRKVRIRDCFLRTFDDSICVKGFDYVLPESEMLHNGVLHDVFEDVVVERCTIWDDWGRALEIGAETRAREIRNVVFRDCDVIALHEAPLDVQNCDQAYVHDIVYENIRIEYDPDATWTIFSASAKDFDPKNRRTPQVFAAVVIWFIDEYSKPGAENRGRVSDVVFRDIDIFAPTMPPCRIKDFDENHRVERVSFERIRLNGEEVAVEGRCDTHKAKVATSDAEKNQSTEMNAAAYGDVTADGDIKVLFIGNSITLHGVAPQIGWTNRWGMAASSQEKDYVHLVAAGIARETGRKPQLHVKNLYEFEHTFQTYDFSAVNDLVAVKPDYLIIALGENVKDLNTEEDRLAYQAAFGKLLDKFTASGEKPRAVVRGVFWPNEAKDICMENAAKQHGIPFVKANFAGDPSMKAIGLFAHPGVANHPGDRGMAAIANAILKTLFP